MINIQDLSKKFERDNLFEHVNLVIHPNERIAFVGKNGSGKTTFFNCLAGKESFEGRIFVDDIKISLMEQDQNFSYLDKTFEEYLKDKKLALEKRKTDLEAQIGDPASYEDEAKFDSLMDEYNLLLTDPSFSTEDDSVRSILEALKMDFSKINQKIKSLSGGQKTKLRLAECLSKKADFYLLDEPTNNLDLETREWLEGYINKNIKNLIVISHDRYFMNKVVTKVLDLENKTIKEWKYKFGEYLVRKKKYTEDLEKHYFDKLKRKKKLEDSAKDKRDWAARAGSKQLRILADRLERDANRIDTDENPFNFLKKINIHFKNKELHDCTLFTLEDVGKKFDTTLFEHVNQDIDSGDRVCIIGENGTGKSTFLKMLIGDIEPSSGEIIRRKGIKIGYFDQELAGLDREQTMMDFFLKETGQNPEDVISLLVRYGFERVSMNKKIKFLSGGEKGRLNILRITLEEMDVLVLDEPTNNLDIYLIESLEKALKRFKGTIIFVSHDRSFVDNLATRMFKLEDGKIKSFRGNYSEYLEDLKIS